ncbi:acyltransferase family protein [Crenothrix sp.]|uniref:acyltransferase family protein n=1 Tax=Crenothrix sp. TaxID=3100433 RepID=UPI00374CD3BD
MPSIYRSDLDGLRAVAVLSVILCHAQIPGFAGGFVGVDIFLVISGFLISGIILREIAQETFSFKNFYMRRVRRILPALLTVLFVISVLAWFVMLPNDFRRFGKALIASIFMIPNIAAWSSSGDYFAPSADSNPLLHLWSLGVEEQFYLLFPLPFVFLLRKFSACMCWTILTFLTLSSLGLAFWAASHKPAFGFYWLPTRAWEFLLGIGVAYYFSKPLTVKYTVQLWLELLAFAGLLLIIFAVSAPQGAALGSSLPFQIMACSGTTLLITTGLTGETWVYKCLALKPIVGIGLISYSLYLWHWPLLSLFSYWQAGVQVDGHDYIITGLLILSGVMATLNWKYIEQPFRNKHRWLQKPLIKTVLTAQILLLGLGIVIWYTNWTPQRFNPYQLQYAAGQDDANPLQKDCLFEDTGESYKPDIEKCLIAGHSNLPPRFIVWGDSHADALTPAFETLGELYNVPGIQVSYNTGAALLKAKTLKFSDKSNDNRQLFYQNVIDFLQQQPLIKDVFLVGYWNAYTEGSRKITYLDEHDSLKAFQSSFKETIKHLTAQGKRVWVVLSVPKADRNVPLWLALNETQGEVIWIDGYLAQRNVLLPFFEQMQADYKVRLLDPSDLLCRDNKRRCRINSAGKALYSDYHHLSATGAIFVAESLMPAFKLMQKEKYL